MFIYDRPDKSKCSAAKEVSREVQAEENSSDCQSVTELVNKVYEFNFKPNLSCLSETTSQTLM